MKSLPYYRYTPQLMTLLCTLTGAYTNSVNATEQCSQNIQCSESADWGKTTRSVVRVQSGGSCSGTLLNNTAEDDTVYIATAGHCFDSENETGISIDFNYEIACNADQNNPRIRPRNFQTLTNGYLVAWDPSIDAALIKFDAPIPDGVDAYFAGWDLTDQSSSEPHALIHHVGGGAKSFALANSGRTYFQSNRSYNPLPQGNYYARKWHTQSYDIGYMGGGSSGAGLFYGDEYFVGILNGPAGSNSVSNTCENGPRQQVRHTQLGHIWEPDNSVSPPIIPLAFSNFKEHLDPLNTGVTRLPGRALNSNSPVPTETPMVTPTPSPSTAPTVTPTPSPIATVEPQPSVPPIVPPIDIDNRPTPSTPNCIDGAINFDNALIGRFADQDVRGETIITDDGCSLIMSGNNWKLANKITHFMKPETVLVFEMYVEKEGEIHGILFDTENPETGNPDRLFQLAGKDDWGIRDYTYTQTGTYQTIEIPVGLYFAGYRMYIGFASDDDANSQTITHFRNVRFID